MPNALADLSPGQSGRVTLVAGEAGIRHRLLEMGLTRGTTVRLVRVAPLGDPLELAVRGYRLSVRRSEAGMVRIEDADG
ncbi:MAG TPA: ferrous iron transport protein A [Phycisphaerae bacterium]|nr:ferrous iron transport protein A [Phycisphaerae bacterium]